MTHSELVAKYEDAVKRVQRLTSARAKLDWDFFTTEGKQEADFRVALLGPSEYNTDWLVYDRKHSPRLSDKTTETLWVLQRNRDYDIVPLFPHDERTLTNPDLEELIVEAIINGWLPGQPDPTI